MSKAKGPDYFLSGLLARNRALDGDVVAVQVLPSDQWEVRKRLRPGYNVIHFYVQPCPPSLLPTIKTQVVPPESQLVGSTLSLSHCALVTAREQNNMTYLQIYLTSYVMLTYPADPSPFHKVRGKCTQCSCEDTSQVDSHSLELTASRD